MNIDTLTRAIEQANKDKPSFIGQYDDGTYLGWKCNKVKTRRAAMTMINVDHFVSQGLTPIKIK